MNKYLYLLIAMLAFGTTSASAQNYIAAIGLRTGFGIGVTGKLFIDESTALEAMAEVRNRGFGLTGMYEIHHDILGIDGMQGFYGGGAHLGFTQGTESSNTSFNEQTAFILGVDGIAGIEYTIPSIPINLSLDFKPSFNFLGTKAVPFFIPGGAVSFRYIISQ
ncbi:hypothetical protein [Pontibacter sp. G13]|uniref:hypothetical protein n=1 Tax=Pontibacter sp. G13 TaxID=3074898 RepID=UPI00288BB3B0|nr:hypothetical protein [Pontibacter sp. G13]WNJ17462.1 hypothetical protein RJD25_21655 [Pontibacter sp. G13]